MEISTNQTLDTVIKFIVRTGEVVLGSKKTLKLVKLGKVKYVIMASNVPEELRYDIEYYSRLSNAKIIRFPGTNKELGTVIGKPFGVAVMGIISTGQIPLDALDRFVKSGE